MTALTNIVRPSLPAPMSPQLDTAFRIHCNALDPEGLGFSIAAEDAPDTATRGALQRRYQLLGEHLKPIGPRGAAAEVMALSQILAHRKKSANDVSMVLDLYVRNLADMPAFAVVDACLDYQQGRVGDRKWMPELPELRVHALSKMRDLAREHAQIGNVLKARIRAPRASAERRAETVAQARELIAVMQRQSRQGEAERTGKPIEDDRPETPEMHETTLAALKARNEATSLALSAELRRKTQISRGIDPDAWEDEQRLAQAFEEQDRREA